MQMVVQSQHMWYQSVPTVWLAHLIKDQRKEDLDCQKGAILRRDRCIQDATSKLDSLIQEVELQVVNLLQCE